MIERILLLGSKQNDMVLDPFMGSGTTGLIARRLNRNFIGIELEKGFFKISEERILNEKNNKKIVLSDKKIIQDQEKAKEIISFIEEN